MEQSLRHPRFNGSKDSYLVAGFPASKCPPGQPRGQGSTVPKWSTPPSGRLNFNGAWSKDRSLGGVGIVVRDDGGIFVDLTKKLHSQENTYNP